MPFTAALAARLSLTYHSVLTAERLADKYLQRRALHDAGLPGPAVWEAPAPGAGEEEDARAVQALADRGDVSGGRQAAARHQQCGDRPGRRRAAARRIS